MQLADLAHLRSGAYSLLSAGLRSPTPQLVAGIREPDTIQLLEELLEYAPSQTLSRGVSLLLALLRGKEMGERELKEEYDRLFLGSSHVLATPYESVYTGADGTVMGEAAFQVMRAYAQGGMALSEDFKDLPDHAAVELEFMARLCLREAQAWMDRNPPGAMAILRQERAFLKEHLTRWLPSFAHRLASEAQLPFYPLLAEIASLVSAIHMDEAEALLALYS